MEAPARDVLTLRQVADVLQVTVKTVRELIADRQLAAFKVRRHWRVTREALDDFIRRSHDSRP